jgi:hypothetical protein
MKSAACVLLLFLSIATTGCAPMLMPPGMSSRSAFAPVRESPVGRWDVVLDLDAATIVGVLTADGAAHTGRVVRVGMDWLRIVENGAEIDIARDDVARVDVLSANADAVRTVAGGAGTGALLAGGTELLFSLLYGRPTLSGRTLAAGAAGGAVAGVADASSRRTPRTIYISPRLIGR